MKSFLKKFVFVFSVFVLFAANNTYAEGININLRVKVGNSSLYNSNMSVLPCDSNDDGSLDEATAYCALSESGLGLGGSWSEYGYFLESIGDISGYPDPNGGDYHYWAFYSNGEYSMIGASSYVLKSGDTILFDFTNPSQEDISKVKVKSGGVLVIDQFSMKNAVNFILSNQKEDGSFNNSIITDWVAIGVSKTKEEKTEGMKSLLIDFLKKEKFEGKSVTDYERHAMTLMALNINPYDGTDINYISKIVNSFDGEQVGDKTLINDDIFALLVLQNAGYTKNDEIIKSVIKNILKNQSDNGSWGSADITSASIMALSKFKEVNGVNDSILKAFKFIKTKEISSGNYGNVYSSSWAMQAFGVVDWYEDEVYRISKYLTREQHNEGGFIKVEGKDNQIWATSYSIPAMLDLSWTEIMESFPKQEVKIEKKNIPIFSIFKKDANVEKIEIPGYEDSVEDSNIIIDSNKLNISNLLKNKVIIMTIILVVITFIGGWFVIKK